jgi:hypothetical protein
VWARHPDADVNRPMMLTHRGGDGDNKARSPGRARRKPLKPLRREGRIDSGEPVVTNSYAFYFCIRGCGRIGRPVFPAPSVLERGMFLKNSGRTCCGNEKACLNRVHHSGARERDCTSENPFLRYHSKRHRFSGAQLRTIVCAFSTQ